MTDASPTRPTNRKPLRLWPGVAIAVLLALIRYGLPAVRPEAMIVAMLGGMAGALLIILWWLFFSRAPWLDRLGGLALIIVGMLATPTILHQSIASGGQGMLFTMFALPVVGLALVAWAVLCGGLADGPRRAALAATILLACGAFALLRTTGVRGDLSWDFAWRWSATAEERMLARAADDPLPDTARATDAPLPDTAGATDESMPDADAEAPDEPMPDADAGVPDELAASPAIQAPAAAWPGFRGPGRDGVVRGVRIATDWTATPPVELWRRPVGPGWSSFAVDDDRIYTQEQRGDEEAVASYHATTGEPLWVHRDPVRFWEAMAGAGPRATPTLADGRVYAFGATGILNALDRDDGTVVWSRDVASDTGFALPIWGFASSPLVTGDLVIVATGSQLAAYHRATGEQRWIGPAGGESYTSPHLVTLDGEAQVLMLDGAGAASFAAADGTPLWTHAWKGFHSLQPALTADGDLLVSASGSAAGWGIRRLAVRRGATAEDGAESVGWTVEERWTSTGLKPYFNDFVVHDGHAYGLDGRILSCIDLADGERKWKGGRYGHGQLVVLADQGLLLVLSERGELALVRAAPDGFTELARLPSITGKTWNHPVLVGDLLLVRNGEEMAAYRLPSAS